MLKSKRVTPKMFAHSIKQKCIANPQRIVLPEVRMCARAHARGAGGVSQDCKHTGAGALSALRAHGRNSSRSQSAPAGGTAHHDGH